MASRKDRDRERMQRLRHGADGTYRVAKWPRFLAGAEYKRGGAFPGAVRARNEPEWTTFARETFARLYGMADAIPEPEGHQWLGSMHAMLEELPEFAALRERARGDAWAASLMSAKMLGALADQVQPPKADQEEAEAAAKTAADEAGAAPGDEQAQAEAQGAQEALSAARAEDAQAAEKQQQNVSMVRSAARKAASQAQAEIQSVDDAASAFGCGHGPGNRSAGANVDEQLLNRLRTDRKLQRIAKMAGRLGMQALAKQSTKATPGAEEVCDIIPGSDLGRLLPSELLGLASEEGTAILYRKLSENAALNYELRGREQRAEGPIVVCLDESGSMSGHREEWSKAVVLALFEIAAKRKRDFAIVKFDSRTETHTFPRATREGLAEAMSSFRGGGTDIGLALKQADAAMAAAPAFRKADVVVISDGCDNNEQAIDQHAKSLRDKGASIYGIGIDAEFPKSLAKWMESVVVFRGHELTDSDKRLDGVFSM